ncbi:hypothetical protein J1614_012104 [Plenodomus biglobosus]|nr:hypothetical protein J1614_012104 [Plenodomus biglobosus]
MEDSAASRHTTHSTYTRRCLSLAIRTKANTIYTDANSPSCRPKVTYATHFSLYLLSPARFYRVATCAQ